jgi:aspartate/methionine/tyrosine aminotransferase
MSKAYGLPGLRLGWVACRDHAVLERLERAKHYTSICNTAPGEFLARLALEHADAILARNHAIVEANNRLFEEFVDDHKPLFDYRPPDGSCVAFPRYLGSGGVEAFCQQAVEQSGVLLLPASVFRSALAEIPNDRFRIGIGRKAFASGLAVLREQLAKRGE